jgi:hypothetical protein
MQGAQSANPIVASGHVPHQKAEYMTAPDFSAQAAEKTLQRGGRPYMTKLRVGYPMSVAADARRRIAA